MAAISIDRGSIQVFDNAVPAKLYAELVELTPRLAWEWGWRAKPAHERHWHHELSGGSKSSLEDTAERVRAHPIPTFGKYVDWLRGDVVPAETRLLRLYFNAHTFGTDGTAHSDSDRHGEVTLILFMNQVWKPEYGGETVVFDAAGEIEASVMPKANRLVAFPSNRLHAPRPLSKMFFGLRVVLVAKLGAAEGKGLVR